MSRAGHKHCGSDLGEVGDYFDDVGIRTEERDRERKRER